MEFGPGKVDIIYNANPIHISSEAAFSGLLAAAGGLLKPATGILFMYGSSAMDKSISPQSNIESDQWMKSQNVEWGLREIADLEKVATANKYYCILVSLESCAPWAAVDRKTCDAG